MKGKILTVLGPIDPDTIGQTLVHEHLLHKPKQLLYKCPLPTHLKDLKCNDFRIDTLGWIRQYPYCFAQNLEFSNSEVMKAVEHEMVFYKQSGGGTLVENSSIGLRTANQMSFLKNISEQTGVNIISGTGYYVSSVQTEATLNMSCEQLENEMRDDIVIGVKDTGIKCGVIGEIGCTWPLHAFEKKVLRAAAGAQCELHCPIIIHPGRSKDAPEEIIRCVQEAGGKAEQVVMSHLDRTFVKMEDLAEYATFGTYCSMDLFGIEVSHYQLCKEVFMPSDGQRIARLHYLIDQGFGHKIVVGHDIHTRHRLMQFGGHGYSHIFLNVVPMMQQDGFTDDMIQNILVDNPKQFLTFQ